jgi:tetratricopeptide (TPR) repeat protein
MSEQMNKQLFLLAISWKVHHSETTQIPVRFMLALILCENDRLMCSQSIGYNKFQFSDPLPSDAVINRFHGVPMENKAYVNRPAILGKMTMILRGGNPSSGSSVLVLRGLSGMGKTQLMLRYCYVYPERYDFVYWLNVDDESTTHKSFRRLALNLGLDDEGIKELEKEDKVVDWVRLQLECKAGWLLLLDNADDKTITSISKLLPRSGGDVILTTRSHYVSSRAETILVDKMEDDEVLTLLFGAPVETFDRESDRFRDAQKVAEKVDCMPLAADLARAFMEYSGVSFQDYLEMLKERKGDMDVPGYSDEDVSGRYKSIVATVCGLSIERIRLLNPVATEILNTCAFLQPDAIPVRLFERQYAVLELPALPALSASDPDQEQSQTIVREAAAVLVKFSFLAQTYNESGRDDTPSNDTLTIHRLVQTLIRDGDMGKDGRQRVSCARLIMAMDKEVSPVNYYDLSVRKAIDAYIPHIRRVIDHFEWQKSDTQSQRQFLTLLSSMVQYLGDVGAYKSAIQFGEVAYSVSETLYGLEHLDSVQPQHQLAWIYYQQGRYSEAEPLYQRALAISEKALGPEHPNTSKLVNKLARLYDAQGMRETVGKQYRHW